jgi:hypothetical protein
VTVAVAGIALGFANCEPKDSFFKWVFFFEFLDFMVEIIFQKVYNTLHELQ